MKDVLRIFEAAARDREHGAGEIEGRLLASLTAHRGDWQLESLRRGAELLLAGQPAMANLRSLAQQLACGDQRQAERYVRCRLELLGQLHERFVTHAFPILAQASSVVSLSRSSAVAAVLQGACARGWRGRAVIFDGAASGGGAGQSGELHAAGLDVVSQPDAMIRAWLDRGSVLVLTGADAVSELRGVNAVGTGLLLELARARGITTVLVADSGKLLADAELDEIVASGEAHEEPGPGRRWPLFEVFPLRLVSWLVDEEGSREP